MAKNLKYSPIRSSKQPSLINLTGKQHKTASGISPETQCFNLHECESLSCRIDKTLTHPSRHVTARRPWFRSIFPISALSITLLTGCGTLVTRTTPGESPLKQELGPTFTAVKFDTAVIGGALLGSTLDGEPGFNPGQGMAIPFAPFYAASIPIDLVIDTIMLPSDLNADKNEVPEGNGNEPTH